MVLVVSIVEEGTGRTGKVHATAADFRSEVLTRAGVDALSCRGISEGDWVARAHQHTFPCRIVCKGALIAQTNALQGHIVSPTTSRTLHQAESSRILSEGVLSHSIKDLPKEASP